MKRTRTESSDKEAPPEKIQKFAVQPSAETSSPLTTTISLAADGSLDILLDGRDLRRTAGYFNKISLEKWPKIFRLPATKDAWLVVGVSGPKRKSFLRLCNGWKASTNSSCEQQHLDENGDQNFDLQQPPSHIISLNKNYFLSPASSANQPESC
jgi:hypothetical protein